MEKMQMEMRNIRNILIAFLFICQLSFAAGEKEDDRGSEKFLVLCFSDHMDCHKKKCRSVSDYYWVSKLDSFVRNSEIYPFFCNADEDSECALCEGAIQTYPDDLWVKGVPHADSVLMQQNAFFSQFKKHKKLLQTITIESEYGKNGFIKVYYAVFNGMLDLCTTCQDGQLYDGPIYVYGENSHLKYDSSFNRDITNEYKIWDRYNFVEFQKHLGVRNYVHTR
jgi:hypothetical protein